MVKNSAPTFSLQPCVVCVCHVSCRVVLCRGSCRAVSCRAVSCRTEEAGVKGAQALLHLVHLLDLGLELVAVGIKLGVLHGELVPLELLELRSVAHRANHQQTAVPD